MPIHSLTANELAAYRADGFLVRRSVFSETDLTELREAVERAASCALLQSHDGKTYHLDNKRFVDVGSMTVQFEKGSETIRVIEPVQHLDPTLNTLVDDARIVEPMQDIIGSPEISVWTNKLNLKRAKEGSGFGWHQEGTGFPERKPRK